MKTALNRRDFMRTLGLGAASLAIPAPLLAAEGATAGGGQRNVLFIAVDDLRPQVSCYGHEQMISPSIDRLASEGVMFSRAYCQVPVCGASRASLLSGVRPNRNRFVDFLASVDKDLPGALTLPKHFQDNGYRTISNGKVYHHLNDDEESWGEAPWRPKGDWKGKGYQTHEAHEILEKTRKEGRGWGKGGNRRIGLGPAYEAADVADNQYPDGVIAEKAISDLRRLKEMNEPFFLAVGFMKPHLPFNAPKRYWDLYKREEIDLADNPFRPKDAPDCALHNWGELRNQYANIPQKGPLSDDLARTLIHGYYACVSYVDAQIGKLLDELERLGLRENTIVVLWGDHGWNLGEHGLWCKHCNFETSLHSLMIASAPGIEGGKKTDALTEFVDIYPSLCELCNLSLPSHLEGTSFVPLMKDPDRSWKKAVFSRYFAGDSVKTDRYRYTEWTDEPGKWPEARGGVNARMLYDHQTDPVENVNISELPENEELVSRLKQQLRDGWSKALPSVI